MSPTPGPSLRLLALCLAGASWSPSSAWALDDHLLLCEAALTPTGAEFLEIWNPTAAPVSLGDYYLADDDDYALLPGASGGGPAPALIASDFVARFPAGATLPPCGVVVVALDGAGFLAAFGFAADFEILGTDSGTPNMLTPLGPRPGAGLTDAGEGLVLFTWDGASDLVRDVDLVNAGIPSDTNDIGNKTGVSVDGPDVGTIATTYQPDAATMPDQTAFPGATVSTKRATIEGAMESSGGNGQTGDDETSEDILVTWDSQYRFTRPNPGSCALTNECYYAGIATPFPAVLRAALHERIRDHERFPYDSTVIGTWKILELADEDPGDSSRILDVYQNSLLPKSDAHTGYQREHSWPKSFGFPDQTDIPYTDCHALFLAAEDYNNNRSNHPYRACTDPLCVEYPTHLNYGQGGPGHSNWEIGSLHTGTWETWDGRRGDVARAQFYMQVRYDGGVHFTGEPEPDLQLTDDPSLIVPTDPNPAVGHMGIFSELLAWHQQDPVDDLERARNEVVFLFQRNRNPFIDHPEWVATAFAGLRPIFADDFESGDTSAWSVVVP